MNVQLNDSGIPIMKEKTLTQKIKGYLLWAILIVLTIAAALLVYLCFAGASEMAGLTTFKQVSDHPYYTMSYENFNYDELVNKEPSDNNAVIQYYKKKFFKSLYKAVPGQNTEPYVTKGSVAFFSRTDIYTYMKCRIYNSYDTPIVMITCKPVNGYKSWNIIDMSDVGIQSRASVDQWYSNAFQTVSAAYCTSEGINVEGLSVSLISCPVAKCDDTPLPNVTPAMGVRLMLDRASTVEAAIEVMKNYDVDFSYGAYHYLVCEKEGKSAVIEYVNGEMSVKYMPEDTCYQVCSNKMESDKVSSANRDYNDAYDELTLYEYFDSSLASASSGGSGMNRTYATQLLEKKSLPITDGEEEHYSTRAYGTQYTVYYDFYNMKMMIVVENDTKGQTYSYNLK